MKKILLVCYLLVSITIYAQKKIYGSESFSIVIPNNFKRTIGINDYATIQFESTEPTPNSYGFLIFEHKDELRLSNIKLDIIDYTMNSIEPYTKQKGFSYIKKPYISYEKNFNYAYTEFETNVEDSGEIYFLQTVIETKDYIYQILQYCEYRNKDLMKNDFISIINSFKVDYP